MENNIEPVIFIIVIGTYLTLLGARENFECNSLSLFLASAGITGLVFAQLAPSYLGQALGGESPHLSLNLFWGLGSYWVGLILCDRYLPDFSVDWNSMVKASLAIFGFFYILAMSYIGAKILFLLMCIPAVVLSLLLPLSPWIEGSDIHILHHWD